MGGRTATLLIAGSACAAVLVMAWSLLAALSLTESTPYWVGSIGVISALGAAFLIFKDLVLWPFRAFGPRLEALVTALRRWVGVLIGNGSAKRPPRERSRATVRPPRRQH